ncbi:hypothetical protein ACJX0J_008859, partial [Zea mays]
CLPSLFSDTEGHLQYRILILIIILALNGTAEVVFTRRSDAIAALKPMKKEVIGNDLGLPMTSRINVVGASNGRATRTVVMTLRSQLECTMPEFSPRGRGSSSRPL